MLMLKMSLTNNIYDECKAQENLNRSVLSGSYKLNTPNTHCKPCFTPDPSIRIQQNGVATCNGNITDLDSELMGLTNKSTDCRHQNPNPPSNQCNPTMPEDCNHMKTTHSRLTNPPCELKGIGVNRFPWLPCDPQDKAIKPFQTQTQTRLVEKDNFRPCIKEPLEEAQTPNSIECEASNSNFDVGTPIENGEDDFIINDGLQPENGNTVPQRMPPQTHFRSCKEIQDY